MKIDEIENGIVFDHIKAGKGMEVYNTLRLDKLNCQVAIIQNAKSEKMGAKDIIKINELIDINLDVLCYIDKNITVNVIKNGKSVFLFQKGLPMLSNVQTQGAFAITKTSTIFLPLQTITAHTVAFIVKQRRNNKTKNSALLKCRVFLILSLLYRGSASLMTGYCFNYKTFIAANIANCFILNYN